MKEEKVTKNILDWLELNGWDIICYDFPQSGTGVLLHPNNNNRTEKNKGGVIPDIIAAKNNIALFFENKDRFYEPDFSKLNEIREELNYSDSIDHLLFGLSIKVIYYGIGIVKLQYEIAKSENHLNKIDFLISTDEAGIIEVHYDNFQIFSNA